VRAELLNARVLIVDDDRDTLEIMRIILDTHGAQTAVAATAAEGLRILRVVRPEVLLSDISLPDQDGCEFVRSIRALPADEGGDTPAVAVSAHVFTAHRERAFDAGFQAFLAKPLNPATLVACVKAIVERARAHLERRHGPRRGYHTLLDRRPERRMFERRQPLG
jgi:CheY-like chemotaxis protein